jgi:hypothetical protein
LNELISAESSKNEAEDERKRAHQEQQRAVFAEIKQPLAEILEAAGSAISRKFIGEGFANLEIVGPGSRKTTYDIEPNSVGKFSTSPSPAPGYCVKTETSYNNEVMYIEPIKREYVKKDKDELLEDLMKHIAEAMAKNR